MTCTLALHHFTLVSTVSDFKYVLIHLVFLYYIYKRYSNHFPST